MDFQVILEKFIEILNTDFTIIGLGTFSIGFVIVALVKFLVPTDKKVKQLLIQNGELRQQQIVINSQKEMLEENLKEMKERVSTLEKQVETLIRYNPNKNVRNLKEYNKKFTNKDVKQPVRVVVKGDK